MWSLQRFTAIHHWEFALAVGIYGLSWCARTHALNTAHWKHDIYKYLRWPGWNGTQYGKLASFNQKHLNCVHWLLHATLPLHPAHFPFHPAISAAQCRRGAFASLGNLAGRTRWAQNNSDAAACTHEWLLRDCKSWADKCKRKYYARCCCNAANRISAIKILMHRWHVRIGGKKIKVHQFSGLWIGKKNVHFSCFFRWWGTRARRDVRFWYWPLVFGHGGPPTPPHVVDSFILFEN